MPTDEAPTLRRRASSGASASSSNNDASTSVASSRPKRRSRGLPMGSTTPPRRRSSRDNAPPKVETPPEYKKPAAAASQKPAVDTKKTTSSRSSTRSSRRSSARNKTSPKSSPQQPQQPEFKITQEDPGSLLAAVIKKKSVTVQLKLNDEVYNFDSSSPLKQEEEVPQESTTRIKTEPFEDAESSPKEEELSTPSSSKTNGKEGGEDGSSFTTPRASKRQKLNKDSPKEMVEKEDNGSGQEPKDQAEEEQESPRRRSKRSASIASVSESMKSSPDKEDQDDDDNSMDEEDDSEQDNGEEGDDDDDNMEEDDDQEDDEEDGDEDDEDGDEADQEDDDDDNDDKEGEEDQVGEEDEESKNSKDLAKRSSPRIIKKTKSVTNRRRASLPTSSRSPSSRIETAKRKKKKKKEKETETEESRAKQKSSRTKKSPKSSPSSSKGSSSSKSNRPNSPVSRSSPSKHHHRQVMNYGANATPAFYFFLAENRSKLERSLSRRHRYFTRLPKGYERNELVAKEAAAWWLKLKDSEMRRFMNLSMRDMEERITEWKEAKNIQNMTAQNDLAAYEDPSELTPEDELMTFERHNRLFLGTTVGCKPYKPESGVSHNRILLELLQDMRFHPAPMFIPNRDEVEYGQMDFSRVSIPYFDVHGPVSTSMGDDCLGCTRGWAHYCNVLKRKVPAVDHRARLQPPLSSVIATRVGLGLQPKPQTALEVEGATPESVKNLEMLTVHENAEAKKARCLPCYHFETLSNPADRSDDIVRFIEETVAMKVSEPTRPTDPTRPEIGKKGASRAALPLSRKRSQDEMHGGGAQESVFNKCGRCRTVIQTDTGCIQCRRAQLVINLSKKDSGDHGMENESGNYLKVSTQMLGRLTMKEGAMDYQSPGDVAIAQGILRQRWTPFAVLPPQPIEFPKPKQKRTRRQPVEVEDSEADSSDPGESMQSDKVSVEDEKSDGTDDKMDDSSHDEMMEGTRTRRNRASSQGGGDSDTQEETIDRQLMAQKMKDEASELNKKCVQTACFGILLGLMRRDPLLLFASPVSAEGYSTIIKNPIDFGKIKANVLAKNYNTLGSFVSDAKLLCTNALIYNPPGSIYWKTAKELQDVLGEMQKRASEWIREIKDCHANAWRNGSKVKVGIDESDLYVEDVFEDLRTKWPQAVEMLDDRDRLRQQLESDFMRTKENETAYYGGLAIRRAAIAADASLAPYPDQAGIFNPVGRRSHVEDENLRNMISERVAEAVDPVQLKDIPMWREESIMRLLRRSQSRRLDGLIGSVNGCARCDGMRIDQDLKTAMTAETIRWGRQKKKNSEVSRVVESRMHLSTGNASQKAVEEIKKRQELASESEYNSSHVTTAGAVTVKGSGIHGWGLFADQPFKAGEVVAEYIGEYVSPATTEARERMYQEQRIQDYQFRIDDHLVIDATMKGGHGRYINHSCSPNCIAKIIRGETPNEHLKRVLIIAQRDIDAMEELSYDYQFPLELDLKARIACNCHSEQCRGFMNWDLPEKGSNSRVFRSQKRGANMRDRIRRLGRPLKGDK